MDKKRSIFNKKKWLRNYLEEILRLKKQGSTHQAIIQHLTEQQNMPFDLSESLLSRYLKEFAEDESTYKKVGGVSKSMLFILTALYKTMINVKETQIKSFYMIQNFLRKTAGSSYCSLYSMS